MNKETLEEMARLLKEGSPREDLVHAYSIRSQLKEQLLRNADELLWRAVLVDEFAALVGLAASATRWDPRRRVPYDTHDPHAGRLASTKQVEQVKRMVLREAMLLIAERAAEVAP